MPVVPIGFANAILNINCVDDPEVMQCSLGVEVTTPPWDEGDSTAFVTEMATQLLGDISTTAYFSVGGRVIVGSDGDPIIHDVSFSSISGAQGADPLPQNAAVLVQKNSSLGGRKHQGRFFVPGVDEDLVLNNGLLASATYDAFVTSIGGWLALFKAHDNVSECVILHTNPSDEPTVITSFSPQRQLATQRRRLRS